MVTPTKPTSNIIYKTPLGVRNLLNNDELERSSRRSTANTPGSHINDSSIALDDNEELRTIITKFQENKITKDNAWNNPLIDTLVKLISNHRRRLKNFQVCGLSLDASTRIYNIRVDSVHDDVMRMSCDLNRLENAKGKRNNNRRDDEGEDEEMESGPSQETGERDGPAKPAKKKKKPKATVTKCKESINGKFEKVPFMDPLFAEIKSNFGEIGTSNRAFINTLESVNSELILGKHDRKYFDKSPMIDLTKEVPDDTNEQLHKITIEKFSKVKLRTIMRGYKINDKPADIEDICNLALNNNSDALNNEDHDMSNDGDDNHFGDDAQPSRINASYLEVAFDMNAEVEPMPPTDLQVSDIRNTMRNSKDNDNIDEFSDFFVQQKRFEDDAEILHSMQPVNAKSLEYSYRDLDITKYWAGPSYWKIKQKRPNKRSIVNANAQRGKRSRKQFEEIHLTKYTYNPKSIKPFNPDPKMRVQMKNWDAKKLLLPINLNLDESCFSKYIHLFNDDTGNLKTSIPEEDLVTSDGNSMDMDHHANDFDDIDHNNSITGLHNNSANQPNTPTSSALNVNNNSFGKDYSGGPEKLEKIILPYSTRSKNIDMKQLEKSFLISQKQKSQYQITDNDRIYLKKYTEHAVEKEEYKQDFCKFSEVYNEIPNHLDTTQKKNLSLGLAFLSALQNANTQKLRFLPDSDSDFKIFKIIG